MFSQFYLLSMLRFHPYPYCMYRMGQNYSDSTCFSFEEALLQRLGHIWFKTGETIYFRTYSICCVDI
ncbi:hypothetical protein Y032_0400g751 [Ancylostoma ceylanicum]|uniref:Uncharacterized protein n=1 Tax=Ancylostoma ceylanicum TaxID=53326 RepID=A0A016RR14_9BILA|nr:hypothetical protein Y032_0400g751 [Ancylostoma ceylanicum]